MTSGRETARDVMSTGAECIGAHETLDRAAQLMRNMNVGALPVCGPDERVKGIITDRDIVVKCIASGHDPSRTTAGELAGGLVFVTPETSVDETLTLMEQHQIKRLPVLSDNRVVGMIAEADLAKHLPDDKLAEFMHHVYARD